MQSEISSPNSHQLSVNSQVTECLSSFQIVAKYAAKVKSEALISRSKGKEQVKSAKIQAKNSKAVVRGQSK